MVNDYQNSRKAEAFLATARGFENNNFKIDVVFDIGRPLAMSVPHRDITQNEKLGNFIDNLADCINCAQYK